MKISPVPALVLLMAALSIGPATATLNCLRDNQPYKLAGDSIDWSMTIKPGANCIQGLRWSTMQIFSVSIAEQPKRGELVLVGPGFRYFAKSDFNGDDSFSLVVVGKNRHDAGQSVIHIKVSSSGDGLVANLEGY
ncbi:Ig-like domain-containing protein [Bradyrhizobium sp. LTSP849]|uniref:Ig-like domain-containing protein n=1 Tax=Bradyrhizobium sp. LTSP849 TaxID=1615890 RepID=UPI000A962213|nr:Ig-like domain-containing protein [Bradyrhizobium sp. LTSP849]